MKQTFFPRYRGINLDGMFCTPASCYADAQWRRGKFIERDFQEVADFGFDFVRLPLSYRLLASAESPYQADDRKLELIDQAIAWGEKHHLHVDLNLHRAPGYCINCDEKSDPFSLADDDGHFCRFWEVLAARYRGISSDQLTFDLLNEPDSWYITQQQYIRVMEAAVEAVHGIDPTRLCMIDGWNCGNDPVLGLTGLPNVGQSVHCYRPSFLTHYTLGHADMMPAWPMRDKYGVWWDREVLAGHFDYWVEVANQHKMPIHCGELGCYKNTPRKVMLSWLEDLLAILKERNIGWAWWTCHGGFGLYRDEAHPDQYDRDIVALLQRY